MLACAWGRTPREPGETVIGGVNSSHLIIPFLSTAGDNRDPDQQAPPQLYQPVPSEPFRGRPLGFGHLHPDGPGGDCHKERCVAAGKGERERNCDVSATFGQD